MDNNLVKDHTPSTWQVRDLKFGSLIPETILLKLYMLSDIKKRCNCAYIYFK